MKKLTRTKILIDRIEAQIEKNQRRIKDIAKDNYNLRKTVSLLKALPKGTTLTKTELEARDKTNRIGKFYDAAFHEEQRVAKEEADKKVTEATDAATDDKVGGSI